MTLLITGSRNKDKKLDRKLIFDSLDRGIKILEKYLNEEVTLIVHGAEPTGVDSAANIYGITHDIKTQPVPAQWKIYGHSAGMTRNEEMFRDYNPQAFLAVWDGVSPGTKHMFTHCVDNKCPGLVINMLTGEDKFYV